MIAYAHTLFHLLMPAYTHTHFSLDRAFCTHPSSMLFSLIDAQCFLPPTLAHTHSTHAAPCWNKQTGTSFAYLAADVGIVAALAVLAFNFCPIWAWPLYWFAQGTMFWALFVVGHDW